MASITCLNHGQTHTHFSVHESKVCYGIIAPPAPPEPEEDPCKASKRQLKYISDLGGDVNYARLLSRGNASKYIKILQRRPKETPVEEPKPVVDRRIALLQGMIDAVPIGYYAVGENGDDGHLDFVRISKPTSGKYKGCIKVQTQHSSTLIIRGVKWPSGQFSIYQHSIVDALMLLVVDHFGAQMRYGRKMGTCMRCNAELTDVESRRLMIGPECRKIVPGLVEAVEEQLAIAASV